ncbi:hypothetical protein AgCh_033941 [Apium graveolens]
MKIFDSIDYLHEGRFDWNLRVRLVREWDSYNSKAGREFKGKNLLLVDDREVKAQHVRPIIAIVSSCRYGLFKEEVQLSNLPATRFFINYDHPAVEHFRERRKVKIVDVEEKSNWWHYICTKCHLPVKELKHDFECEKCKRIVPVPEKSFKLCVNVEDDSVGAAILLYDREVQRISGKNVYEVFMEQKKSRKKDKFPSVLKNIEGKQYTCTKEIIENNVKQRSYLYTAVDILEGVDSVEYSKNHTGNTEFADGISESISLDSFTPDTEKSTTIKPNKRKIEDVVVENMQELADVGDQKESGKQVPSPVLLKNIKKERVSCTIWIGFISLIILLLATTLIKPMNMQD